MAFFDKTDKKLPPWLLSADGHQFDMDAIIAALRAAQAPPGGPISMDEIIRNAPRARLQPGPPVTPDQAMDRRSPSYSPQRKPAQGRMHYMFGGQ